MASSGSILVFSVGSAICGAAPSMSALIVGRVIAGAGGAGLYLGMLNLIAIILSKENGLPTWEQLVWFGEPAQSWGQ